jgi:hypothetical protein
MDTKAIAARIAADMGKKRQSGAWGKIKQHAKRHGEEVANEVVDELDSTLDKSGWSDDERKLYRETVLETIKRGL